MFRIGTIQLILVLTTVLGSPHLPYQSIGSRIIDLVDAGVSIGTAVVEKFADTIPTPWEIFDFGKQLLAGLPFELVAGAIKQICSLALISNATESRYQPNFEEINYLLMTPHEHVSIPLFEPTMLWADAMFKRDLKVVVLVTGWTTDLNVTIEAASVIYEAYKVRGDSNFILLDTARYIDTLYTWSAFNTQLLGDYLGDALADLSGLVPLDRIHLIGHSLGAQICGAAGRKFYERTGSMLPRITGLDPANPCFNEGESLSGLMRGDAEFVDVIHTNVGVLGHRGPIGDVDFYPNGVVPLMPGCVTIICSHVRAWKYYAESVLPGNENNFPAVRCSSLASLENGACTGRPIAMGHSTPTGAKGNFFLKTNSKSPFGRNSK